MKYTYYQLGIMAAVVSFLGFVVENIWLAMTKGYINNRNMNAPFLLGYGLLILFMYAVFGTPAALRMFAKEKVRWKRYLVYFLCSFAVVCVGEIVLGIVVEALCHIEYWNYSNIPMHITKYTSIPTSTAFAAMITILMGNVFPVLMDWICRMPYQCPMGENHLYCTVGGYGSGLFRQLRTYDKSEEFLFKMENIPESKKVAVINPQKRIKDKKRQAAAICAVPVLFV